MATKATSNTTSLVSDTAEINTSLMAAYKYRIMTPIWHVDGGTKILHTLTNSITYANMTARQYSSCRKYEDNKEVFEFSASVDGESEDENGSSKEDEKRKEPKSKQKTSEPELAMA